MMWLSGVLSEWLNWLRNSGLGAAGRVAAHALGLQFVGHLADAVAQARHFAAADAARSLSSMRWVIRSPSRVMCSRSSQAASPSAVRRRRRPVAGRRQLGQFAGVAQPVEKGGIGGAAPAEAPAAPAPHRRTGRLWRQACLLASQIIMPSDAMARAPRQGMGALPRFRSFRRG